MKTDAAFAQLFSHNPKWLQELTQLDLPDIAQAAPCRFKQVEREADLVLTPANPEEPHYIVEFQMQHDGTIYNRTQLYACLLWETLNADRNPTQRNFRQIEVRKAILFGSRQHQPPNLPIPDDIRVLFLEELIPAFADHHPDSPLVPILATLDEERSKLENHAREYYRKIQQHPALSPADRTTLLDIFQSLFIQRFKNKNQQDLLAMIAELTPIEETRVGRDLLEQGRHEGLEQGLEQGQKAIVLGMYSQGLDAEQIARQTTLPLETVQRYLREVEGN